MNILDAQTWCLKHGVPYIHGCLWDRDCRSVLAPKRIYFFGFRGGFYVDLPYYGRDLFRLPKTWHGLAVRTMPRRQG